MNEPATPAHEHDHDDERDEHSEERRAVLMGNLSQLKYFRAVPGHILAGPRWKLCAAPLKAPEV